jgi:RimJ/RimL family protein N-acetyltransferase
MLLNADTTLSTPSIRLVPYLPEHVAIYHAWMEDADLRAATGSERLTLAEERAMQAAWREDGDKLTFIVLDGAALAAAGAGGVARPQAVLRAMVGDVNLFFQAVDDDDGDEGGGGAGGGARGGRASPSGEGAAPTTCAEVEVMIAAPSARGRGLGAAAVRLLLAYARKHCGLRAATAKVGRGNAASLSMFQGRLGFGVVRDVEVFDERHLRVDLPPEGVPHPAVAGDGWVEEGYGAWASFAHAP